MSEQRDILEALFVGDDVDRAEVARTASAAREDGELRELFDRLAVADRQVGGDFEARFGEAWFLNSLDEMLDEEQEPDNVVSLDSRRSRGPVWLAAAAVVAVGFGILGYEQLRTPQDEFQPRSAASVDKTDYQAPSVEVFCVKRTDAGVEFVGSEQAELATVQCALDQEIKLAVRNPDAKLRYAAFFGVADDNSLYWYGPSPAAVAAIAVPTGNELTPIGETIRLDTNHEPGTVRLVGVFSERALDFAAVERWTRENARELRDGDAAPDRSMVVRQTFEVTQ